MSTTTDPVRNGVDTAALFATIDAVRADPEIARFQFRAENRWMAGTHSRSTIHGFAGAKQELQHADRHEVDADHPAVLVADHAPTPVEHLLHALAACLTAGIANIGAARRVTVSSVTTTIEGDIDLRGILGLDDGVRNGFEDVRVAITVTGDDPVRLREVVEQSRARSAVFDIVTNGVPVTLDVAVTDLAAPSA